MHAPLALFFSASAIIIIAADVGVGYEEYSTVYSWCYFILLLSLVGFEGGKECLFGFGVLLHHYFLVVNYFFIFCA